MYRDIISDGKISPRFELTLKVASRCMSLLVNMPGRAPQILTLTLPPPFLRSRTCPARLMTSPRGRRPGWAQLSARADPPAGAAAAARGSKGWPVTRDSRPSLPTLRHISLARGAGRLPPPWDRPRAPLSRSSRGQVRDPSHPPTDPLPTPLCRVTSHASSQSGAGLMNSATFA